MTQVISIDTNTAKNILETLRELKTEVARLRKRLEDRKLIRTIGPHDEGLGKN